MFFTYNRPEKTLVTIQSVIRSKPRKVYFVSDGPKSDPLDQLAVEETRKLATLFGPDTEVITVFADSNLGLKDRFFSALDLVFSMEKMAIILEDDCSASGGFFDFCERLLQEFEFNNEVGIVSGYNFAPSQSPSSYFFDYNSYVWGWATWARVWNHFRRDRDRFMRILKSKGRNLATFSHPLELFMVTRLLNRATQLNTWDVPFSHFLRMNRYLNITPTRNFVSNIGFDATATNQHSLAWQRLPARTESLDTWSAPKSQKVKRLDIVMMWNKRLFGAVEFVLKNPIRGLRLLWVRLID